jgi:hypothetical protein
MCSLILLRRPGHAWPLLLAANRDELVSRRGQPPGRHWPDRPEVVAGRDPLSDGSWLGLNDHGVAAALLNRTGTLGPAPGKRSRGELVLEALDHAEADAAAGALADLSPDAYRPFNLVIADPRRAYRLRHDGTGEIRVHPIATGLHMITAAELDDPTEPRIARHLPRFRAAPVPAPATDDWEAWATLLRSRDGGPGGPTAAMTLALPQAGETFATIASSLMAIPAFPGLEAPARWLHADDAPDCAPYRPVPVDQPPASFSQGY